MSTMGPGDALSNMKAFLEQIGTEVIALDGRPPSPAAQDKLHGFAHRARQLAESQWQKKPLPGDVKFALEGIDYALADLANADNEDCALRIQEAMDALADCDKKAEASIVATRRAEEL